MFCAVYSMDPKLFIPCLHHEGGKGNRLADDFLEELLLSVGFSIFIGDICTGLQTDGFSRKVKRRALPS